MSSPDARTLCVHLSRVLEGRSTLAKLRPGHELGMLGLEFHTRRRNRVNCVVAAATEDAVTLRVLQSYGNCPKYIQKRAVTVDPTRQGYALRRAAGGSVSCQGPLHAAQRQAVRDVGACVN